MSDAGFDHAGFDHAGFDDDRLARIWTALGETARPRDDCPDPARLWEACGGDLPGEPTRALAEHMAACPTCAESWRLARELTAAASAAETPRTTRGAVAPSFWRRHGMTLAAAAAIVAALTVLLRVPGGPAYREGADQEVRSLVAEGQARPRTQLLLRWSPAPAGARYDVQVATEDLKVVARARGLLAPSFHVPVSSLQGLPAGTRLLWQVEALLPDGRRLTSRAFSVRLE